MEPEGGDSLPLRPSARGTLPNHRTVGGSQHTHTHTRPSCTRGSQPPPFVLDKPSLLWGADVVIFLPPLLQYIRDRLLEMMNVSGCRTTRFGWRLIHGQGGPSACVTEVNGPVKGSQKLDCRPQAIQALNSLLHGFNPKKALGHGEMEQTW
eukprot:1137638-Pelagomonas_calceolata.AAC.1